MDLSKLNIENQIEYFKALHEESDPKKKKEIAEKLFLINRKLVYSVSNRIGITDKMKLIDRDDIYDLGDAGLLKAIEKFDYTRGFEFSTFARYVIKRNILLGLRQNQKLTKGEQNLEDKVNLRRKDDEPNITIEDSLSDNENYYEDLIDNYYKVELVEKIKEYVNNGKFSDRNKYIFNEMLRNPDKTGKQLAKELNTSSSCISSMKNQVLDKIRDKFKSKNDPDLSL